MGSMWRWLRGECTSEGCRRAQCEAANLRFRRENPSIEKRGLITRAIMCDVTPSCVTELLFSHTFHLKPDNPVSAASICRRWRRDDSWPTADPHLQRSALKRRVRSFWEVLRLLPNRTVWIHGDSVMLQLCNAALCSLMREGVGTWPLDTVATSPVLRRLHNRTAYNMHSTRLPNGATLLCSAIGVYQPAQVAVMLRSVDVAILNFGLHYYSVRDVENAVQGAVQQLQRWRDRLPRRRMAFWRETSAQHFPGGAYRAGAERLPTPGAPCQCEPLNALPGRLAADPMAAAETRRLMAEANLNLRAVAIERRLTRKHEVGIVPLFNLTAPRHDMHRGRFCSFSDQRTVGACCDCTHFCYTPVFWDVVFGSLHAEVRAWQKGLRLARPSRRPAGPRILLRNGTSHRRLPVGLRGLPGVTWTRSARTAARQSGHDPRAR